MTTSGATERRKNERVGCRDRGSRKGENKEEKEEDDEEEEEEEEDGEK